MQTQDKSAGTSPCQEGRGRGGGGLAAAVPARLLIQVHHKVAIVTELVRFQFTPLYQQEQATTLLEQLTRFRSLYMNCHIWLSFQGGPLMYITPGTDCCLVCVSSENMNVNSAGPAYGGWLDSFLSC